MRLANDKELDKLEKYKGADLVKSIAECNLFLQTGAFIVVPDIDNNRMIIRDLMPLYRVMNYVDNNSIPKEALVEEMYKAYSLFMDSSVKKNNYEKFYLRNIVFEFEKILKDNSLFKPYIAKNKFNVSGMTGNVEVNQGESLYLSQILNISEDKTLYIMFNFDLCQWLYLNEDEMKNLEEEVN